MTINDCYTGQVVMCVRNVPGETLSIKIGSMGIVTGWENYNKEIATGREKAYLKIRWLNAPYQDECSFFMERFEIVADSMELLTEEIPGVSKTQLEIRKIKKTMGYQTRQ